MKDRIIALKWYSHSHCQFQHARYLNYSLMMMPINTFVAIASAVLLVYIAGLYRFFTHFDENRCGMTYMYGYPQFVVSILIFTLRYLRKDTSVFSTSFSALVETLFLKFGSMIPHKHICFFWAKRFWILQQGSYVDCQIFELKRTITIVNCLAYQHCHFCFRSKPFTLPLHPSTSESKKYRQLVPVLPV